VNYKNYIIEVPDFPKPGISFKDISPLLENKHLWNRVMMDLFDKLNGNLPDYWVGIDSRGFLLASTFIGMINNSTVKGMKLIRKKGKLPPPVISEEYELEYGTDTLEMKPGKGSVVIMDDVYATGGTMKAAENLCKKAGYDVIGKLVLIDLLYLHDKDESIKSLAQYE
jgi:adenine phosphoribosyltransferase